MHMYENIPWLLVFFFFFFALKKFFFLKYGDDSAINRERLRKTDSWPRRLNRIRIVKGAERTGLGSSCTGVHVWEISLKISKESIFAQQGVELWLTWELRKNTEHGRERFVIGKSAKVTETRSSLDQLIEIK